MLLVPALAGLMASAQPSKSQSGGSPRVRGEKGALFESGGGVQRFTSRARGKDLSGSLSQAAGAVHLACAGKRQSL